MRRLVKRPSLEEILDFCAREPIERVFLEDVARRGLGRFAALRDGGELVAVCHLGANLVPSGVGAGAFAKLAARAHPRMLIGDEGAVTDLWEAARADLPEVREDRPGQPVYVLDERPTAGESGLREATLDDLDLLVRTSAAAFFEEVGIDAYARDPALFEWRTRVQIEERRSWLWVEDGTVYFKAEASAWTDRAVQLQQVWVDPQVRGNGYGKRGLSDLCGLLLERTSSVCLFVRPENEPAIALYDSIGMRRVGAYRSLIFA
ncbi:MAG TPA: GNAT family N-acetyltransferase [Gaiellaceae bacterium]|jgi:ribosomal protein S18 acetylase RimI-like enzyme|nr:GNAT family N-acetyltransferase [Gaiellaceae bacterium]